MKTCWPYRMARFAACVVMIGAVLSSLFPYGYGLAIHYTYHPPEPSVREDKIQVACIGDSITYGAGVTMLLRPFCSYPAYLQRNLGREYHVQNYGLSGRTLQRGGDDPYVKEDFYRLSHERVADIYLIMLGSNDSKPWNWDRREYVRQMKEFLKGYQELDEAPKVYLLTPPWAYAAENGAVQYGIQPDVIADEIIPDLREVAGELDVGLIDIYRLTVGHTEWFSDGVHLNAEGNRAIASAVTRRLLEETARQ